jgi:hypothetical protein
MSVQLSLVRWPPPHPQHACSQPRVFLDDPTEYVRIVPAAQDIGRTLSTQRPGQNTDLQKPQGAVQIQTHRTIIIHFQVSLRTIDLPIWGAELVVDVCFAVMASNVPPGYELADVRALRRHCEAP